MREITFKVDGAIERYLDNGKEIIKDSTGFEPADQELLTYCILKMMIESDGNWI